MLKKISILLFMSFSLTACAEKTQEQNKESALIDYKYPKSICYGRLTLTVPKETTIVYGRPSYDGIDLELDEEINSLQKYEEFIRNRIDELKKSPHETEKSLYHQDILVPVNGRNSHIIVFRENEYSESMYQVYGYLYLPLKRKMLILKGGASNGYIPSGVQDVKDLLSNLRFTKTDKPGTCFNDFYVEDYDNKKMFMSEIFFRFPSYPQVRVSIDNRSRLTSDVEFIPYVKKNKADLPLEVKMVFTDKTINIDKKTVNSMNGEEYSYNMSRRLVFERGFEMMSWQYLGTLDNIKDSYVKFDLISKNQDGNEPDDALVSEKLVTELGYFILNNIKNNDK